MQANLDAEQHRPESFNSNLQGAYDFKETIPVTEDLEEAPTFPEGGFHGWMTVFGAFLVQYVNLGYTSALGVYQDFYVREYLTHYSASAIGWIGGAQIFLVFAFAIFTGRLYDRGYFHHLMITAVVLHSLALFMLSLTHENSYYQVFLSQGICLGISCGLASLPSLSIVSQYFYRQRPLAMGLVASGSALGGVLHPIMLNKFFHGPLGFHNGVRVSAGINTFLFIIANLLMRTRLPSKTTSAPPSLVGFFRDPPYIAVAVGSSLLFCGLNYPEFYLQLDAILHGVDENIAFYVLSITSAASVFGRIIAPIFVPRFGIFNMLIFATISSGAVVISMIGVKDVNNTVVFAIFCGITNGATTSLFPPAIGSLSKNMNEFGTRIGMIFALSSIINLISPPILGAILTSKFHWTNSGLFAGIMMFGAAGVYAIARMFVARRKGSQFV